MISIEKQMNKKLDKHYKHYSSRMQSNTEEQSWG